MNKIIITLVVCVCIALCGCAGNGNLGRAKHNESIENIAPNILDLGDKENGYCYYYAVDVNTGVVYLCFDSGMYRHGITVMLNRDGTPVTAEQLGIPY